MGSWDLGLLTLSILFTPAAPNQTPKYSQLAKVTKRRVKGKKKGIFINYIFAPPRSFTHRKTFCIDALHHAALDQQAWPRMTSNENGRRSERPRLLWL